MGAYKSSVSLQSSKPSRYCFGFSSSGLWSFGIMSPQPFSFSFSSSSSVSSKVILFTLNADKSSRFASDIGASSSSLNSAFSKIASRSTSLSCSSVPSSPSFLNKSAAPNFMIAFKSSLSNLVSVFFPMTALPVVSIFWITRWSKTILLFALWMISSSTLELDTKRKILTSSFWPILCALAMACKSFWGLKSESNIMTLLAVCKLIPKPPALVDNKKQKSVDPSALKFAIDCFLLSLDTLPVKIW